MYRHAIPVFALLLLVSGAHLPQGFKVCKKSDTDYKECARASFEGSLPILRDGISALGMQPIEPLFVEKIHIDGNGGKVDIVQDYDKLNVKGLSYSKVKSLDMKLEGDECKINFETLTPTFIMSGHYKIVGKVLILGINGVGGCNITVTDLIAKHEIDCEKVKNKNGDEVLKVLDYRLDLSAGGVLFDFENLIDGNAQLSTEVLKVINESSMEIFGEIRVDYARTFAEIFKSIASRFLIKVPLKEYYTS